MDDSKKTIKILSWTLPMLPTIVMIVLALGLLALGIYFFMQSYGEPSPNASGGIITDSSLLFPTGNDETEMATCIDSYIKSKAPTSYLNDHGADFVTNAKSNNVNPALLLAIGTAESSLGTTGIAISEGGYNYYGMTAVGGGNRKFSSVEEAIAYQASYMRDHYLNGGFTTLEKIQQEYAPVGASNDPNGINAEWLSMVTNAMKAIRTSCSSLVGPNESLFSTYTGTFSGATALPLKIIAGLNNTRHDCSVSNPGRCSVAGHRTFLGNTSQGLTKNLGLPVIYSEAIDLGSPAGTAVFATFSGVIVAKGDAHNGVYLIIKSSDGSAFALFAHINSDLSTGTAVNVGDQIGTLAISHVHFELWIGGVPVNAGYNATPKEIWTSMKKALGK